MVVGPSAAKSPWMGLTLYALENNGLLLSLRRGAREGDFSPFMHPYVPRQRRQLCRLYTRGVADWTFTRLRQSSIAGMQGEKRGRPETVALWLAEDSGNGPPRC